MKAKKSLIITLFAAVMIFALGATAAFALSGSPKADWGDYTKVTISGCTGSDAVYNRDDYTLVKKFNTTTGQVDVTLKAPDVDGIKQSVLDTDPLFKTSYYDLNNSAIATASDTIKGEYANGKYTKGSAVALQFKAPDYVTNKTETAKVIKTLAYLNAGNWQGKVIGDEEYDPAKATEQKFQLSLDVSFNSNPKAYDFIGVVPAKEVKVLARAANAHDVQFFKDKVSTKATDIIAYGDSDTTFNVAFAYDGAAHKVVSNEVAGLPVSYEVFNKTTGKYDPATECPTVQNVGDTAIVKATVSWTETTTVGDTTTTKTYKKTNTFNLSVGATTTQPKFAFDPDGNVGTRSYGVDGAEYDAYAYILAVAATTATDEDKAAIEANKEALQAYFKDYYEITSEASKAHPEAVTLTIKAKTLSAEEVTAIEKKYEALMKNFNIAAGTKLGFDATTATMNINGSGLNVPEIEFTDSPTVVTYKAKKLKKKAASFTVTATSSNGVPVTYKLINAPAKITIDKASGMITLNKGLKKGKYKVTVKAFIAQGFEDRNHVITYPSETHNILIKVKK